MNVSSFLQNKLPLLQVQVHIVVQIHVTEVIYIIGVL